MPVDVARWTDDPRRARPTSRRLTVDEAARAPEPGRASRIPRKGDGAQAVPVDAAGWADWADVPQRARPTSRSAAAATPGVDVADRADGLRTTRPERRSEAVQRIKQTRVRWADEVAPPVRLAKPTKLARLPGVDQLE